MSNPRAVVLLLMLAYAFNAMDRSIIPIIGQSIKDDLLISDTQLGLLSGTAFALLYAFGGLPIARLAERISRVNIITTALSIWSALTAMCGLVGSFTQLLLIRMGIGVAEAGCVPPAHSLISDYVEPRRRASALSVYSCGISVGYIMAAIGGGWVTQRWGWRAACLLVGLPGILMAIIIKRLVREPPRSQEASSIPPFSLRSELAELAAVGSVLFCNWSVVNMLLGITIGAFAAYGFYAFLPVYFVRTFDLDYSAVGLILAFVGGLAVAIGILAGGFVADRLAQRDRRWYAGVPAAGGLLSLPLYAAGVIDANWLAATLWLALAGFFQYALLGPTFGVLQNVVAPHRRATATALLYILLNVVALGGGPLFVGSAIDHFANERFQEQQSALITPAKADSFARMCPGGQAVDRQFGPRCREALTSGTRAGLLASLLFFAWASLHYLMAVPGIRKALAVSR